jgi:hypothetical protein
MSNKKTRKGADDVPAGHVAGHSFILKVVLDDVQPQVWRRFVVPASITLDRLDEVLQTVMGWRDSHIHGFTISGKELIKNPEDSGDGTEESGVLLGTLVHEPQSSFVYNYDFGDGWTHTVTLESVKIAAIDSIMNIVCLDGEGHCPPEDVGGPGGYRTFLKSLANSNRPRNESDGEHAFDFNLRDEANALIPLAVRNGPIENLHAGKYSPYIEDETLSHISDEQIKTIMIHAAKTLTNLHRMRDEKPELYNRYLREYGKMYCRSWQRDS